MERKDTRALFTLVIHPREREHVNVNVIVNLNNLLVVVQALQMASILLQRALPGDGHEQKKRIQAGIVEALADTQ
jgi:hypothetical protein